MRTFNLFRTLPVWLLGALLSFGSFSAHAVHEIEHNGLFELDGNAEDAVSLAVLPDDWETLHLGGGHADVFTGITPDLMNMSIFGGGNKDIQDVSEWSWTNGSVPDKSDITNAYAASYTDETGDLILYFGADRFDNVGDTFLGFWFFKQNVMTNDDGTFNGNHDDGDTLVLVNFPQANNALPLIQVLVWDSTCSKAASNNPQPGDCAAKNLRLKAGAEGAGAVCGGAGGDPDVCAITNLEGTANDGAFAPWDYLSKDGDTTFPFETFFEGGINFSDLIGGDSCFSTFMAETRASSSFTAQLKDFVLDDFPLCGIEVSKECTAGIDADGDDVDVTIFGTVENTGAATITAYIEDSISTSTIDDVCIDVNGEMGCQADDTDVTDLVLSGNTAHFTLAANQIATYVGSYSVTGLPEGSLTDTIIAEAYSSPDDIGVETPLATSSDDASCDYDIDPKLEVTKDCTLAYANANNTGFKVTVSGSVKNTGDVPLSNLQIIDSEFGSFVPDKTTLPVGETANFGGTFDVSFAELTQDSISTSGGVTTLTLSHSDTASAAAQVLANDGETVLGTAEGGDPANCPVTITNGVTIEKNCEAVLVYDDTENRIVVGVDVTTTVTNIGDEDLTISSLIDDPLVDFGSVPATLAGDGGMFTATGRYFPSTTDSGDEENAGNASFSDTVTVNAVGMFTGTAASDSETATCDLCPPHVVE